MGKSGMRKLSVAEFVQFYGYFTFRENRTYQRRFLTKIRRTRTRTWELVKKVKNRVCLIMSDPVCVRFRADNSNFVSLAAKIESKAGPSRERAT